MGPDNRLIVALDLPDVARAETLVEWLGDTVSHYKIGYRLALSGGLELARDLAAEGRPVFLDMKLLDIGQTVAHGVESAVRLGVSMLTIHAYPQAMRAGVEAARGSGLTLLGVTVLTSMNAEDTAEAGYAAGPEELVRSRAAQALEAGMGGVVCSPREAAEVRGIVGPDMAIVTPGIRLEALGDDDQKRVAGPAEALKAGASHLVVGRPITGAADPRAAASRVREAMLSA